MSIQRRERVYFVFLAERHKLLQAAQWESLNQAEYFF